MNTALATAVLTFILVLGNIFDRVFDLLINYDMPFLTVLWLILLLVPFALTFTLPWGLLVGILMTTGRMNQDLELQAVRASGIGLAPLISPVILFSLGLTILTLFNNAILSPRCMTTFRMAAVEMGRSNPTIFLRAQEPIDRIPGIRMYVERKSGQQIEGIHIWELDRDQIPTSSVRADRGIISADVERMEMTVTLYNVRQEKRSPDPTQLGRIEAGARAQQIPITFSLRNFLDTSRIQSNITILTVGQLGDRIFGEDKTFEVKNFIPLLTELQKRMAMAFSCFTFALVAIPLAIFTGRREASVSFGISLGVVVIYYLLIIAAEALKDRAGAYPELWVWAPNFIFQALGFALIWKVNRAPF